LLFGTGQRAQRLVAELRRSGEFEIVGACSPHARSKTPSDWAGIPLFQNPANAIDMTQPDVTVVASSTATHFELTELCLDRRLPALVEKPVMADPVEAWWIAERALRLGVRVQPAHQFEYLPEVAPLRFPLWRQLEIERYVPAHGLIRDGEWNREELREVLFHSAVLAVLAAGAEPLDFNFFGSTSRGCTFNTSTPSGRVVIMDIAPFEAGAETLRLTLTDGETSLWRWTRTGGKVLVEEGASQRSVTGGEVSAMLASFALNASHPSDAEQLARAADCIRLTTGIAELAGLLPTVQSPS